MNIDYLYRLAEDIQNDPYLSQAERLRRLSDVDERITRQNYLDNLLTNMGDSSAIKFEVDKNAFDEISAQIQADDFFEAYKNPSPELLSRIEIKDIEPFVEPARSGSSPIMGANRTYGKNGVVLGQSPVSSGDAFFGRDANFVPTPRPVPIEVGSFRPNISGLNNNVASMYNGASEALPRPVPIEVGSFRPNISGLNNNVASMYNGASEALPIPTSNPVTPVTNANMNLNGFEEYAARRNQLAQLAREAKRNGNYDSFVTNSNFVLDMDDAGLEKLIKSNAPGWTDAAKQELGFRKAVSDVTPFSFDVPSTTVTPPPGQVNNPYTSGADPWNTDPLPNPANFDWSGVPEEDLIRFVESGSNEEQIKAAQELYKRSQSAGAATEFNAPSTNRPPTTPDLGTSADDIAEELYGEWKLKPTTPASSADEVAEAAARETPEFMQKFLAKYGDEVARVKNNWTKLGNAAKAIPGGKYILPGIGVVADAAFAANKAYNQDPLQDEQARTIEAIGAGGGAGVGGLAGAAIGQALIPIPVLGPLVGGVIGANLGEFVGRGGADLLDRGWGDDGREANLQEQKDKALKEQLREMEMIANAQNQLENRNAIFQQQLARQVMLQDMMGQMFINT